MGYKQTYTMIFWRHAEKEDIAFDDIAKRAYDTLQIFNKYFPEKYRPNYTTVKNKSEANLYNWNYEDFCNDLMKNVNHTRDMVFKDLGYSLSFFSSLNDESSCGYMIHVGATNKMFLNTISVNLSIDFDYFNKDYYDILEKTFYKCAEKFGAFYASIYNTKIGGGKFAKFKSDSVYDITSVNWLNYWSPEILKSFDAKVLKKLEKEYEEFIFKNGFIKLQDKPLNAESEEDLEYKNQVESELGL